jgi:hypothetical protein
MGLAIANKLVQFIADLLCYTLRLEELIRGEVVRAEELV